MHPTTPSRSLSRPIKVAVTAGLTLILATAFVAAPSVRGTDAEAKTPGKTYCFNRVCHRVLTLAETRRLVGRKTSVVASFYRHCSVDRFNPCGLTSSGARFRPSHADNAASPIYPNGTKILVWNPANKRAAVVRIDNAGPYWRNRKLDLSAAAATKLGFRHRGVARLMVQVLKAPTRRQARYRRHRKYAPVPGYIGRYTSMASALRRAGAPAAPVAVRRRRIAAANIVLPVPNTFVAERRRWLARNSEPRPVTVARAATPSIRLPVRLIRSELAPIRVKQPAPSGRQLAALNLKKERTKAAKAKRLRRLRAKTAKRKAAKNNKPIARTTRAKRVKTAKSKNSKKISPNTIKRAPKKQFVKQVAKAPIRPKPDLSWRQRLLGINRSGA